MIVLCGVEVIIISTLIYIYHYFLLFFRIEWLKRLKRHKVLLTIIFLVLLCNDLFLKIECRHRLGPFLNLQGRRSLFLPPDVGINPILNPLLENIRCEPLISEISQELFDPFASEF